MIRIYKQNESEHKQEANMLRAQADSLALRYFLSFLKFLIIRIYVRGTWDRERGINPEHRRLLEAAEAKQSEARTREQSAQDYELLALVGGAKVNEHLDKMLVHGRERLLLKRKHIVTYLFREEAKRQRAQQETEVAKLGELLEFAKREVHNLETAMRDNRAEEAKYEQLEYKFAEEAKSAEEEARKLDEEANKLERELQ